MLLCTTILLIEPESSGLLALKITGKQLYEAHIPHLTTETLGWLYVSYVAVIQAIGRSQGGWTIQNPPHKVYKYKAAKYTCGCNNFGLLHQIHYVSQKMGNSSHHIPRTQSKRGRSICCTICSSNTIMHSVRSNKINFW